MSSGRRIAFFGATGDCAGFTLANSLKAGFDCIALARTPAKLTKSMEDKGVSPEQKDRHLTIVEGNVKDVEAVKRALEINGQMVDTIVNGVGGTPTLQWSIFRPVTLTDTTICVDAGARILKALQERKSTTKPMLLNVSTTGISPEGHPRDVPLAFTLLYHWLLAAPHEDKMQLESKLSSHMALAESQRGLRGYVNVKPSLLMDGESLGLEKVRHGVDEDPAIGYTIRRADVGLFISELLVKEGVKAEWVNKSVTVTY